MSVAGGVLAGVRVLDFGRFIAGPYCGNLLAALGADVIRVERACGGEDRDFVPVLDDGTGAPFLQCNQGKRSLALDLARPESAEVLSRLVRGAAVVLTNMPARTLAGIGLDYEQLRALRPDIIAVNISAFGEGGELGDAVGFDGLMQAMTGSMHAAGPPGHPTRTFASYIDFATAMAGALACVAALMHHRLTGEGQSIEASLFRTAAICNSTSLIEEALRAPGRGATHNRGQTAGPSDVFRTQDGWVMCLVVGPHQFRKWTQMLGRPDLLLDPRFADDRSRGENGQLLSDIMARWCEGRSNAQCLALMKEFRIPGGPVLSPAQALQLPHLAQTGVFQEVPVPGAAQHVPLAGFPARFSTLPVAAPSLAARPGQHTAEVLAELGYAQEDMARLRAQGVVS